MDPVRSLTRPRPVSDILSHRRRRQLTVGKGLVHIHTTWPRRDNQAPGPFRTLKYSWPAKHLQYYGIERCTVTCLT